MNDEQIDQLLRKAPRAAAPAGLLEKLRTDIALPRRIETSPVNPTEAVPFVRRWFPAISFAVIALSCIVAIAVQSNQIAGLKHQNATLQSAAQGLEQLRRDNAEYQRLKSAQMDLERLRRDFAELQQLEKEVVSLRGQLLEIDKLRVENQQLALAVQQQSQAKASDDFFARNEDTRARAESMACINNLKQIGLAARIWATDNNDVLPAGWLAMTNELSTPKILICPSDKGRTAAQNWGSLSAANVSYEYLNPNGSETHPNVILARCTVHGHVGLSDGSVQNGSGLGKFFTITAKDGKQVFTPLTPPTNTLPSYE